MSVNGPRESLERVHLDHNATTPMRDEAREALLEALDAGLGNASSVHEAGRRARAVVDDARLRIAAALGVTEDEVVFTSGGTEANNLALLGAVEAGGPDLGLVTTAIEHAAVLAPAERLAAAGRRVDLVPVDGEGRVDVERVGELARTRPSVVSVMAANNEIGSTVALAAVREAIGPRTVFHSDAVQLLELETDFRIALDRREFELYYQPIVDLERMKITGFEALVRWQHPSKGLIFPNDFIGFAEDNGFIVELGTQVLEMACAHLADWYRVAGVDPELSVSVNIAPDQLLQPNILSQVENIIETAGISSRHLRLELTERSISSNGKVVKEVLHALRQRNIRVSIDDFGTGYSSLSYLKQLPIDTLKIDNCFVRGATHDIKNQAILQSTIELAHRLDLKVVAEGVENQAEQNLLSQYDCDYLQGYWVGRPMPPEAMGKVLAASRTEEPSLVS